MKRSPSRLNFNRGTLVMGIVNVTPDSFSDGGRFFSASAAVRRAVSLADQGADIIDIGGESTRQGAVEISAKEEIRRVVPVIRALAVKTRAMISVDTRKAEVAEEAMRAGALMINDVSGLRHDPEIASVAKNYKAYLVLMHMKGTPKDMQIKPYYRNVISDIIKDLKHSIGAAKKAGVKSDKIIVDPGIGFGKTFRHNCEILDRLEEFKTLSAPICVGTSRKSFIGKALGQNDPSERLVGTIATSVIAIYKGAAMIRVHDVKEAVLAARMTDFIVRRGSDRCN